MELQYLQAKVVRDLTVVLGLRGLAWCAPTVPHRRRQYCPATATSAGYLWPCGPDGKANPCVVGFLPTDQASPVKSASVTRAQELSGWSTGEESSSYQALQVGVVKKISHGVQIQGSFTWARAWTITQFDCGRYRCQISITSLYWFDLSQSRAVSDYNIGRVW